MKSISAIIMTVSMFILSGNFACAHRQAHPLELRVEVGGCPLEVYHHSGKHYIEAQKGREYAIEMTNKSNRRLAVALAVDGLNSIDASHKPARKARKWVIGPWQTIRISGWQVNQSKARKFYFTSEDDSYGAALGKTKNLGVISAVVYREKVAEPRTNVVAPGCGEKEARRDRSQAKCEASSAGADSEDFAATGMGGGVVHRVRRSRWTLNQIPVKP